MLFGPQNRIIRFPTDEPSNYSLSRQWVNTGFDITYVVLNKWAGNLRDNNRSCVGVKYNIVKYNRVILYCHNIYIFPIYVFPIHFFPFTIQVLPWFWRVTTSRKLQGRIGFKWCKTELDGEIWRWPILNYLKTAKKETIQVDLLVSPVFCTFSY